LLILFVNIVELLSGEGRFPMSREAGTDDSAAARDQRERLGEL
jgi:hypothetical protein